MSAERLIRARGLVKRYPGIVAVDRVDVDLARGHIVGLLGKNGAGKSTVIKLLSGIEEPDEGTIELDGHSYSKLSPQLARRHGISLVPQELSTVPQLSVAESVYLGLGYPRRRSGTIDWRRLRTQTNAVLERLGADATDSRAPVGSLTIVQQRLVMIARGIAADAKVLILDEPTASLTAVEIEQLHGVARTLRDIGVTVIYVTHRLDEVFALTDRIVVMRDGMVAAAGPTAEYDHDSVVSAITGDTTIVERPPRTRPRPIARTVKLRVEGLAREGVLAPASFSVEAGEVLGIAGMVGAGRTELVKCIAGVDRATSGRVFVDDRPVKLGSPRGGMRAGIALLPEDRRREGLIPEFSIRDNTTLASLSDHRLLRNVPLPSTSRENQTTGELMERLAIKAPGPSQRVATLSGGNQQKVVLSRWLARDPDVYIFDEPTNGIDVGAKREIYALVAELAAVGKAVIVVASEFGELVEVSDRVLVMREGEILGELHGDGISEQAILSRCYARIAT